MGMGVAERCSVQILHEQHSAAHGAHAVFCITCGVFRWKWKWKWRWNGGVYSMRGIGWVRRERDGEGVLACARCEAAHMCFCAEGVPLVHGSWVRPHFLPCEIYGELVG